MAVPLCPFSSATAVATKSFESAFAHACKVGLEGIDSDFATLIRTFVIVFGLGAFVLATGKWQGLSVIAGKSGLFLVLSALATGASWVCYYRALKIGDAVNVAPVDKLSVVLVAIFAVVFLGERPVAKDWLGIVLVAAGVVLLALKGR